MIRHWCSWGRHHHQWGWHVIKGVDNDKDKEEEKEEKEDNNDREEEEDNNNKEDNDIKEEEALRAKRRPEGPKGGPKGHRLEVGAWRAPKLLVNL